MRFYVFKNGLRYDADEHSIRWKYYYPGAVWSPWDVPPVGKVVKHVDGFSVKYKLLCRNGNGLLPERLYEHNCPSCRCPYYSEPQWGANLWLAEILPPHTLPGDGQTIVYVYPPALELV